MLDQGIEVTFELEGWALFFARLERCQTEGEDLAQLRSECAARARESYQLESLATYPMVAGLRRLFRAAGCDPTRYRPSSEALLRRVLKGAELPAISPLVDLNNCLSLELAAPCCVMVAEAVGPPYILRAGKPGESYESLKGPFNLEGKPLLADLHGPCDAPITGSRRVMIGDDTQSAWLVAYLPVEEAGLASPDKRLLSLLAAAPVASVLGSCYCPAESEQAQNYQDG